MEYECKDKGSPGETIEIAFAGELTIPWAVPMRQALLDGFARAHRVEVNLEQITDIDLTGIQLLCSAHRFSTANNKMLVISGLRPQQFLTLKDDAGFPRHIGCVQDVQKTCLWMGGLENG